MEPRDYAAALCRRWVWVAGAGAAGAAVAVVLALSTAVSYTSSSSVFVGVARAETAEGLAYSSRAGEEIIPSLVELATSATVLDPVLQELGLDTTPAALAGTIDVQVVPDASQVQISATAPSASQAALVAGAVADQLRAAVGDLHSGTDGRPPLRLTTVRPAEEPLFQAAPATRRNAVLGLAAGLIAGILAVGSAQLLRPRIHSAADVAALTGAPPLATVHTGGPGRRSARSRETSLDRLRWLLDAAAPVRAWGRLVLVGTSRTGAAALARDLRPAGDRDGARPAGLPVESVSGVEALPATGLGPADGIVLVVNSGRTSRHALERARAAAGPAAVVGVVLDGVTAPRPGWRARVVAAVRGHAALGSRWGDRTGRIARAGVATSSRVTAVLALVLLGLAHPLPGEVSTTVAAGIALLPVWLGVLPRFRGATLVCVLAGVGLVSGVLLARWASANHDWSARQFAGTALIIVGGLGIMGVVLWARTILPLAWIGVAYGVGRLVTGVLRAPGSENAVKFELALPIALIVLSLVSARRRPAAGLVALAGVALLFITNDGRSAFGFCVVAAALVLWQARPAGGGRRANRWAGAAALGAMCVGAYTAISELLLAGALGAEVQARTATQIAQSGSLLVGGRPEWTATWALMQYRPWGFGLGTVPAPADVMVAKEGIAVTHIPTVESYLENYLLATGFELHSVVAGLWVNLGPAGLALGLVLAALLVRGLAELVSRRRASALVCFMVPFSLWFLAFGPLLSNLPDIAFTIGLVLAARGARAPDSATSEDALRTAPREPATA